MEELLVVGAAIVAAPVVAVFVAWTITDVVIAVSNLFSKEQL